MKRILILAVIAMLTVPFFARESVLIDFTLLGADNDGQNSRTMMNFGHVAGASFTRRDRDF